MNCNITYKFHVSEYSTITVPQLNILSDDDTKQHNTKIAEIQGGIKGCVTEVAPRAKGEKIIKSNMTALLR